MKREYQVIVNQKLYPVIFSDEPETLLAAKAGKTAVIGRWDSRNPDRLPFDIPYLAEEESDITQTVLERVVRRMLGLPWTIAETGRLVLREFVPKDWPQVSRMGESLSDECPAAFSQQTAFLAYIQGQYAFYEYGIWAVEEKQQGNLIGAFGIWDGACTGESVETETGYWISPPFQRQGYGREALKAVLDYACLLGKFPIYADIREGNLPSRNLAVSLGFVCLAPDCPDRGQSGARKWRYRYVPCS